MSEEQAQPAEVTAPVEATPVPPQAPQAQPQNQNRHERRQDRREERANAPRSENVAPSNLFQKAKGSDVQSNPERVNIIKTHIADYVAKCTTAHGDSQEARLATNGLVSAIRNMFTLNGGEVAKVFNILLTAIKEDTSGAFSMGILYRYVNTIKDTNERETYIGVMDLMTAYARLQDPSKIRVMKDVDYAVRYVKNTAAAKAFVGLFPGK